MKCVNPGFLVVGECMALTSAMRKSARFVKTGIAAILGAPDPTPEPLARRLGLRRGSGDPESGSKHNDEPETASSPDDAVAGSVAMASQNPENQLLLGLAYLRADVISRGVTNLSAPELARPFLEVVKSPVVSGQITSLALNSLDKFITLEIISPDTPEIQRCMNEIAHSLTHCRFEATDRYEDDAVLLQLMVLLDRIVQGPTGRKFSSEAIVEIAETCLTMACQMRRGDMLRRFVVATLKGVVQLVFEDISADNGVISAAQPTLELLIDVLDPSDLTRTDLTRVTVLKVLRSCFEVAGASIGTRSELVALVGNRLFKFLAQLARHNTNALLVVEVLGLVSVIMNTCGTHFKLQFEFVMVYVLTALTPLADLPREEAGIFYSGVPNRPASVKAPALEPGSAEVGLPTAATQKSPEVREVMVEFLARLASAQPSFFADLYVTYDCDVAQTDLCSDIVGFLCRNAYPDSATWSTASVPPLCLEAVLSALAAWAAALDSASAGEFTANLRQRSHKDLERRVADTFNNKSPKAGLEEAIASKLVANDSPAAIAKFLRSSRRLNKSVLGKYLAKPDNSEVLAQYIKAFDFSHLRIDEALREFLCQFRLPGESQQIEAIFEKFSEQYIEGQGNSDQVADQDAAFILGYAVIMLNTDQHSPSVKRRMDYDAFKRNVRGANAGRDFSEDYTKAIFDAIHEREIVLPDEHDTDETFEHTWKEEVLLPLEQTTDFTRTDNDLDVVKAVFSGAWRPIVSTLSFVFATATDDLVFSRVITGFHEAATLATKFEQHGALDHIVECLSRISTLASGDLGCPFTNIEIKIEGRHSVIISDLSVPFGSDIKAQMASITLFRLLRVAAPALSPQGWKLVGKALANLHIYGLASPIPNLPPVKTRHTFERSKAGKPVGIFSALSSYLTSSPDTPPEPSDEDVDAALGAEDCIKACQLPDFVQDVLSKPHPALVQGLLDVIPASSEDKYAPATTLLLHLTIAAAGSDKELNAKVMERARQTPFRDVQVAAAKNSRDLDAVLDEIAADVSKGIPLDALLQLEPSSRVWNLLGKAVVADPSAVARVHGYIRAHLHEFDASEPGNVSIITTLLQSNSDVVDTLADLAESQTSKTPLLLCLEALGHGTSSASARTREKALTSLQRVLLSPDLHGIEWQELVDQVLLPQVFEQLLKPEVYKRDPRGMDLTRQQASSLVGKVYLHFALGDKEPDVGAWVRVLKALDRLLSSRRQPALQESVEEMLKNVVLVRRMSSKGTHEFWATTERELKGFLPEVAEVVRKPVDEETTPNGASKSHLETGPSKEPGDQASVTSKETHVDPSEVSEDTRESSKESKEPSKEPLELSREPSNTETEAETDSKSPSEGNSKADKSEQEGEEVVKGLNEVD